MMIWKYRFKKINQSEVCLTKGHTYLNTKYDSRVLYNNIIIFDR